MMNAQATASFPIPLPVSSDRLRELLQSFILREESDDAPGSTARDLEETELAAGVAASPENFIVLYDRYYDRVLNYLYRRTGDRDLAEDLTSRTFLQALASLQRRSQQVCFRPWIYRIATNAHLSHGRSWTVWISRLENLGREWMARSVRLPDSNALSRCDREQIRRLLARLPERHRTVLVLRFYEELPYDDIAGILNISQAGARTRVMRALRKLEELLRREESQ